MQVPTVHLGKLVVTRLIIGGNPFSGISHQSSERNAEMRAWYTDERIIETLFQAQELGINALVTRGDAHITRVLKRYRSQGGTLQWIAQTDSHAETPAAGAKFCLSNGAAACVLHGGVVDTLVQHNRYDEIRHFAATVRDAGLPVGIAGHLPMDFIWAEHNLDLDFYMVSHYNPTWRERSPHHDPHADEQFTDLDRQERVATIQRLGRPVIHYKVLAAGRNDPAEALAYTARHMRPTDAVCVGVYTKERPDMLAEDLRLLLDGLRAAGQWSGE